MFQAKNEHENISYTQRMCLNQQILKNLQEDKVNIEINKVAELYANIEIVDAVVSLMQSQATLAETQIQLTTTSTLACAAMLLLL
uniref:Uncharacterized protein n=1 Tax=Glossina palpalis gambiensis TaxID=67801 RepID=A0A1B0AUB1_9MUSC